MGGQLLNYLEMEKIFNKLCSIVVMQKYIQDMHTNVLGQDRWDQKKKITKIMDLH